MSYNRELTPENMPSTEAQAQALLAVCDEFVASSPFSRPTANFYNERHPVPGFPPLIEQHFSELEHETPITKTVGMVALTASMSEGHIAAVRRPILELKMERTQKLDNAIYLQSVVVYSLPEVGQPIDRVISHDPFTGSPVLIADFDWTRSYSEAHDPTLHRELVKLQALDRQSTQQDRASQLLAALGGYQEQRQMGLLGVSFAEADELINLVKTIN